MMLEEVALYLESKGLVSYDPTGIAGDTFLLTMPDQPDSAVAIYRYGGKQSDTEMAYDTISIQIVVRGKGDPRPVEQRAQNIYNALQSLNTSQLISGGSWVVNCYSPNGGVIGTGKDANSRHEFRINFYLEYQNIQSEHREVPN
jgi:hypothetical protein